MKFQNKRHFVKPTNLYLVWALLENMQVDVRVKLNGRGVIKGQSVNKNTKLKNNQTVVLKAS